MIIAKTREELKASIDKAKADGQSVGFVPTMGALHAGHISLIDQARRENGCVASSLFVNPIQFNNKSDFEKYPITIDEDLAKLKAAGCDILFLPSVEVMYPEPPKEDFDFGNLDIVMEGKNRPGHFKGVATVVKRFFELVNPDKAYFGQKDYQQLLVIKELVHQMKADIEIIACPIIREESGLAMSSRNMRLDADQLKTAPEIYKTLLWAKENYPKMSVDALISEVTNKINSFEGMSLEYFDVANADNLELIQNWSDTEHCVGCIVVVMGEVRLIDNILLY